MYQDQGSDLMSLSGQWYSIVSDIFLFKILHQVRILVTELCELFDLSATDSINQLDKFLRDRVSSAVST